MAWVATVPISKIEPSGEPRATRVAPRTPPAPPASSMIMGRPIRSDAFAATRRLTTSVAPPAANETTRVMGPRARLLWLKAVLGPTMPAAAMVAAAMVARPVKVRRLNLISFIESFPSTISQLWLYLFWLVDRFEPRLVDKVGLK